MPPRSVCLNVFTTSLGDDISVGKERELDVEVREVEDKMDGVESVAERGRHDSVQGSPNGKSLYSLLVALATNRVFLAVSYNSAWHPGERVHIG